MLPEIITCSKTGECRLQEYQELLESIDSPCSDIIQIWGSIFKDFAVIDIGWKALWILSEESCKTYHLLYPTAVIVVVNDFMCDELMASVSVLAVQEDIILPSSLDVPVVELHPIKIQSYDEIDLKVIEDWLDKCRYFFKHLWYPWDAKFNVSLMDWCDSHLQNRILMHCDLKNGVFDKSIANYIKSLLIEAQNLNVEEDEVFEEKEIEKLSVVKKYLYKKKIKTELDLFEKPELRDGMILFKMKEKQFKSYIEKINAREGKLVWKSGNCESLIKILKISQQFLNNNDTIRVCSSLQEAFDTSNTNDIMLLPHGFHYMNKFNGKENGGKILGIPGGEVVVSPDQISTLRAILFECFGHIEFENLTLKKPAGIIIQVFDGTVKISNCRLVSKNNYTSKGVVVLSGNKLIIEDSIIEGFGTGIALQEKANVTIQNTKIINCCIGLKVTDNTFLSMQNVEVSCCSEFGIRMETSKIAHDIPLIGELNLIEQNETCETVFTCVTLSDNKKGNVVVKKCEKVLFSLEDTENDTSQEMICIND